jgi:shikimate kinase
MTSEPVVIVTGGGIVLREENLDLLKRLGVVVWLEADEETLLNGLHELAIDHCFNAKIRKRSLKCYKRACHFYAKIADIRVDTSRCYR